MKKGLILSLLLFFAILPVFGKEETDGPKKEQDDKKTEEEVRDTVLENKTPDKVDFKIYHSKFKKTRNKGHASPKLEHLKTKLKTEKDINKRKEEFKERKETELELLQEEYRVLDYR